MEPLPPSNQNHFRVASIIIAIVIFVSLVLFALGILDASGLFRMLLVEAGLAIFFYFRCRKNDRKAVALTPRTGVQAVSYLFLSFLTYIFAIAAFLLLLFGIWGLAMGTFPFFLSSTSVPDIIPPGPTPPIVTVLSLVFTGIGAVCLLVTIALFWVTNKARKQIGS